MDREKERSSRNDQLKPKVKFMTFRRTTPHKIICYLLHSFKEKQSNLLVLAMVSFQSAVNFLKNYSSTNFALKFWIPVVFFLMSVFFYLVLSPKFVS